VVSWASIRKVRASQHLVNRVASDQLIADLGPWLPDFDPTDSVGNSGPWGRSDHITATGILTYYSMTYGGSDNDLRTNIR